MGFLFSLGITAKNVSLPPHKKTTDTQTTRATQGSVLKSTDQFLPGSKALTERVDNHQHVKEPVQTHDAFFTLNL